MNVKIESSHWLIGEITFSLNVNKFGLDAFIFFNLIKIPVYSCVKPTILNLFV